MSQISSSTALAHIGRDIDRIRREAAEHFSSERKLEQSPSHMRATLSNLIVLFAGDFTPAMRERLDDVIDTLALQHPSRFFVVHCNADSKSQTEAQVRSRCVQAPSGLAICTEEVQIELGVGCAEVLPNLLLSLLVPDIETVLLLASDSEEISRAGFGDMLDALASMVDVILYDSANFERYDQGIASILALLQREPSSGFHGAIARDISWLRLRRWQELLIEQFNAQQFVKKTGEVCSIALREFAAPKERSVSPEAILLLAWCIECLAWQVTDVERVEQGWELNCLTRDKQSRTVHISTAAGGEESSALLGEQIEEVSVQAMAGSGRLQVSVNRGLQSEAAEVAVSVTADGSGSLQSCDYMARRVPFQIRSYSELVSSRIGTQRVHTQRERCVHIAKQISELIAQR